MKRTVLLWLSMIAAVVTLGCDDGESNENRIVSYDGVWDVRYNFTVDECQLVTPGIIGIVDQHAIATTAGLTAFSSVDQLINDDDAQIDAQGDLIAEESGAQDIFGDGSSCDVSTKITYSALSDDQADSLISFSISCAGEQLCSSQGLGTAIRQPEG